jgi:glycosyltransferase involved in cell wall biosynthesis
MICMCDFRSQNDTLVVVNSVKQLLEKQRNLRLWLVGEGNTRSDVYEALRHEGIHRLVVMPGVFVSPTEALQAADLVIIPPSGEGRYWTLPTCLRSGIPVVYPNVDDLKRLVSASRAETPQPLALEAAKGGPPNAKPSGNPSSPPSSMYDSTATGLERAIQTWLNARQYFGDWSAQVARGYPLPQTPPIIELTSFD